MRYFARKKILYFVLLLVCVSIIGLTVAYALLSTTLNISGTADVVAASWNIYFKNSKIVESLSNIPSNVSAKQLNYVANNEENVEQVWFNISCNGSTDSIASSNGTSIAFCSYLAEPGDRTVVSVDVVNGGTIDAILSSEPIFNGVSSEQDVYLNFYATYEDGTVISSGDGLNAGETKTVLVIVEFDKNINSNQLPTSSSTLSLEFSLLYSQK